MGNDQIFEIITFQFVSEMCMIPVANQLIAQTRVRMNFSQDLLLVLGMIQEGVEMVFFKMDKVYDVGKFFLSI